MYSHLKTAKAVENAYAFSRKLILLLTLTAIASTICAQTAAIIRIEQLPSKNIQITLESDQVFIIGARDYHLYIGEKLFTNSKISNEGANNYIQFLISEESYQALPSTANIRLSYGKSKPANNKESSNLKTVKVNNLFDKKLKGN